MTRTKIGGGRRPRAVSKRGRSASAADVADPIKHVIWLMFENRSFDHMLGSVQKEVPGIDGVVTGGPPRQNTDPGGRAYLQVAGAGREIRPDPMHETPNVLHQLAGGNQGFVADYARHYPGTDVRQRQEVMAYHDLDTLPALHDLARHFTVCDRWFSSVPGPTWTNRLFALSGTSLGRVKMPTGIVDLNLHQYPQDTIFDRLRTAGHTWRIYFDDFPLTLLFAHQRSLRAASHYAHMRHFRGDVAAAAADHTTFPDFVFIEPSYLWPSPNDDHPPHDIRAGQQLLATVYNTLQASEALWLSTLLVVAYDEHGGFYDHVSPSDVVPPEKAVPPDEHREEFTFDQFGVRVPALLVSPWTALRVERAIFDHTSVLRYLLDKWSLARLGARTAAATSIGVALRLTSPPRDDAPASAGGPPPRPRQRRVARAASPPPTALNDNEKAIVALSELLEQQTRASAKAKIARHGQLLRGPRGQVDVARARAARFLAERGARL